LLKVEDGQKELLDRQAAIRSSQSSIQGFVANNLRELSKEKSLIAAGNRELASMTETIKKKLGWFPSICQIIPWLCRHH